MWGHEKKVIEKGIVEYPGIGMRVYPLGGGEMAWWVKCLACKTEYLTSILRVHVKVERIGSTELTSDLQWEILAYVCTCTYTHIHIQNRTPHIYFKSIFHLMGGFIKFSPQT